MEKTPVKLDAKNRSLLCPQCEKLWNRCQCSTKFVDEKLVSAFTPINKESSDENQTHEHLNTIIEKYEIKETLGEGGMGSVYLAHHVILNKKVALKILRKDLLSEKDAIERLKREAQACAMLSHTNIVSVFDFGLTENGFPFIVMEYLEGISVFQFLKSHGKFKPELIVKIAIQVCDALEAAHDKNVIHRDLKPDNILLTGKEPNYPVVKIVDFGIAKTDFRGGEAQRLTQTGELVGSPAYMSPEQINGEIIDERSDIYSLGCVLYEMFTGEQLFRRAGMMAILEANLNEEPSKISPPGDDSSTREKLYEIILVCLKKKRADRYKNICELRSALKSLLQKEKNETAPLWTKSIIIALCVVTAIVITAGVTMNVSSGKQNIESSKETSLEKSDPVAVGRILDYIDYFDDETKSQFKKTLLEAKSKNLRLLAGAELIEFLSSELDSQLEHSGKADPVLLSEINETMKAIDKLHEESKTDRQIDKLYLAQCYYIYAYSLRKQADYYELYYQKQGIDKSTVPYWKVKVNDYLLETITYLNKAITILKSKGSSSGLDDNERRILCSYYDYLADNLRYTNNYPAVVVARKKAIELGRKVNQGKDNQFSIDQFVKLADAYIETGDFEKARQSYKEADEYYKAHDVKKTIEIKKKMRTLKKKAKALD